MIMLIGVVGPRTQSRTGIAIVIIRSKGAHVGSICLPDGNIPIFCTFSIFN